VQTSESLPVREQRSTTEPPSQVSDVPSLRSLLVAEESEFQWMSLVLTDNRKCIQPQNLGNSYPSFLLSSSLPSPLSLLLLLLSEKDMVAGILLNRMHGERVKGNQLTQVHLERWPLNGLRIFMYNSAIEMHNLQPNKDHLQQVL